MKIEHIALYVNDLEKARDFFVNYLNGTSNTGYHNPKTDFRSYFISFEDGARLELMHKPEMSDNEKHLNRTGSSPLWKLIHGQRFTCSIMPAGNIMPIS